MFELAGGSSCRGFELAGVDYTNYTKLDRKMECMQL